MSGDSGNWSKVRKEISKRASESYKNKNRCLCGKKDKYGLIDGLCGDCFDKKLEIKLG
jgi:hypothetical protein